MNRAVLAVLAAVVVVGGGALAFEVFAPEAATTAADAAPDQGATVLATGEFVGKANHDVSGSVSIVEEGGETYLFFEEYEQTQGPDVFVYLTPTEDPDTTADLEGARKVLVDGGADGGESTKTGTFRQPLPDDVDPEQYRGVSIWCDRFATPFGAATLE
jgi:hypothetical protein